MASNGNNKVTLWLAGILVTLVLFIAFPTMAKSIIDNDRMCRDRDAVQDGHIATIQSDVREVKTHVEYIKDDLKQQKIERGEMMDILRRIDRA